jgi:hypothetical protein
MHYSVVHEEVEAQSKETPMKRKPVKEPEA